MLGDFSYSSFGYGLSAFHRIFGAIALTYLIVFCDLWHGLWDSIVCYCGFCRNTWAIIPRVVLHEPIVYQSFCVIHGLCHFDSHRFNGLNWQSCCKTAQFFTGLWDKDNLKHHWLCRISQWMIKVLLEIRNTDYWVGEFCVESSSTKPSWQLKILDYGLSI